MILADLINAKIKDIAKKQLRYWHIGITNTEIESLILNISFTDRLGTINEIRQFINSHDALSNIEDLRFYVQCVYGVTHPEYNTISARQIREKMLSEPQNILLAYFWIHQYLREMTDEQVPVELPFFLEEIIDKYPALINLDDFLENSFVITLDKEEVKVSPKLYLHVLEKVTKKYPNKKSFRYLLAMSYLYNGDLEFALDILIYLHNWMLDLFKDYQNDNIEDNYIFYHYTNLVKGVLKYLEELSEFNKVIDITEMVQAVYFSKFQNADQDRYTYTDFFVELSFRKMRAFLHLKKMNDLRMEFNQIQPYLKETETDFWKSEYSDVINVC